MTVEEYNASVFQKARNEGLSVKQIARFYQTDIDLVESLTTPPKEIKEPNENSIMEKALYCTKTYGIGRWHFMTGEEIKQALLQGI